MWYGHIPACVRLTNVQQSKNYFTRDKTTQAVFITKKRNFLIVKRITFIVQHRFLFFRYRKYKNYCLKIHYFKLK